VTTPGGNTGGGLPSDGLIAPLNAPRGGAVATGVQPGVSGNIILAQYVVIFGTTGGLFIYAGSPGLGNPPIYSDSNADFDPYGNPVFPGIWAGSVGSVQAGLQVSGTSGTAYFIVPGSFLADAFIGAVEQNGGSILRFIGAKDAAPNNDQVAVFMYDSAASGSFGAAWQLTYIDVGNGQNTLALGTFAGLRLEAVSQLAAVLPGTGTSNANAAQPETWHNLTLDAGWTAVNQPQYRLLPGAGVQVTGLITHAATAAQTDINSTNPVPSAYRPPVTRYYRPPQAADLAGAVQVSFSGVFTMRASGFGATQAIMDGIYAQ
jgi:hypothetical protein